MINTTLCYIEKDGCFLMLYRNKKKNDLNEGKWVGIGGKQIPGESIEECLLREIKEECNLKLDSYTFRGLVHFVSDRWEDEEMYLYTAETHDQLAMENDEGEMRWIPVEEVPTLPLWEGDRIFFDLIARNAPEFELLLRYEGDTLVEHSVLTK